MVEACLKVQEKGGAGVEERYRSLPGFQLRFNVLRRKHLLEVIVTQFYHLPQSAHFRVVRALSRGCYSAREINLQRGA